MKADVEAAPEEPALSWDDCHSRDLCMMGIGGLCQSSSMESIQQGREKRLRGWRQASREGDTSTPRGGSLGGRPLVQQYDSPLWLSGGSPEVWSSGLHVARRVQGE